MARTISFRIPDELAAALAERAAPWRLASESDAYRRILEEWLAMQKHPGIRFMDSVLGRRAALVGGPYVWKVIWIARAYDFDAARIGEFYPWLAGEPLSAALAYYHEHRDEIDDLIEANDRAADELAGKIPALPE